MIGENTRYDDVFKSLPGLYLLLDPNLKILSASDAYLSATMTHREAIVGRNLFEVFPDNPDDPEATGVSNLRASLETVLAERRTHTMAIQRYDIRKAGTDEFEQRFWSPQNLPVFGPDGEVSCIIHGAQDVTQMVRMGQAEGDLDQFFSLSLDLLCIAGGDGYFKRVSPAFTKTLGWSVEELLQKPFIDFVHPDDIDATMVEVSRQVRSGEEVLQFENRYRHKDGSWRILSWKSHALPGGLMYATARDVTDSKAIEAQIAQLNLGLQTRASELEAAKEVADRASRAKSDFLSRMSHELRTPMNAVIGYAQLLQMRSEDPKTLESAEAILKGGRHLLSLINEVLDLARIEAGKLALSVEPVAVQPVIQQTLDLVRPAASDRGIEVEFVPDSDADTYVMVDRQRLLQVLLNLLTNAVKYNQPNGRITVTCLHEAEKYRIEVSDTGVGIKPSDRHKLFQPFERLGDHPVEGTGLGLALSESLMKLMGGTVVLQETSPAGSTFAIELCTAMAPAIRPSNPAVTNQFQVSGAIKIVYIEDNLSNLRLLESIFEDIEEVELLSAMQASVGAQMVLDHQPDLVLLDIHLPDALGVDVLQNLKSDPRTSQIPVVMISADATEIQTKRCLNAGAKSFLTKPIDLAALFAEVNDVIDIQKRAA